MIQDLIKLNDIPRYIFQQTGEKVSLYTVKQWVKIGEIQLMQPQDRDRRFKYSTKQIVNEFIKRYSE